MVSTSIASASHGGIASGRQDPREDWPAEARQLRGDLAALYGEGDVLVDVAGGWVARWPSPNTRRSYARGFRVWEAYCRSRGVHPLAATFPLADAFARYLESAPTMVRVRGGRRGELAPTGKPRGDASRANVLSAGSSFYTYAVRAGAAPGDPFEAVLRPVVGPDESSTQGLTEDETALLIATAAAWSPRAEALVLLHLLGPRVDEVLALDADQLGYERGHRTLPLRAKGGKVRPSGPGVLPWFAEPFGPARDVQVRGRYPSSLLGGGARPRSDSLLRLTVMGRGRL